MTEGVRLKALISSVKNGVWGDDPVGDEGIPCVRAADFDYTKLRVNMARAPRRVITVAQQRGLTLLPGDIVLEKSGGGEKQPVGRAVLYDNPVAAVCSNFAARVRPAPLVDSRYLNYLLAGLYASGATERCIKQTTGIQNLDTDAWLNTRVPRLALDIQHVIADFLDDQVSRIDDAVRLRREQVQALDGLMAGKAHALVTGSERRNQDATTLPWARTLPGDWPVVGLSTVARLGTGHTPSRSVSAYWENCDIPWLTTADVHKFRRDEIESIDATENQISAVGLANSAAALHPAGTVALSRTASAGFSIVMDVPMATSQDFAVWRPSAHLIPGYLLWCLRAMRSDLMGRLAMGSTHKTIYFPDLAMIQIPLPSLPVQEKIATEMSAVAKVINELRADMNAQIALLEERKRSLITAAVTGEFDVATASGRGI